MININNSKNYNKYQKYKHKYTELKKQLRQRNRNNEIAEKLGKLLSKNHNKSYLESKPNKNHR